MSKIKCQNCNIKFSDTHTSCPSCGQMLTEEEISKAMILKKQYRLLTAVTVIALIMISCFVFSLIDEFYKSNFLSHHSSYNIKSNIMSVIPIIDVLFYIFAILAIFLILRKLNLWYWKIDEKIDLLKDINSNLKEIIEITKKTNTNTMDK